MKRIFLTMALCLSLGAQSYEDEAIQERVDFVTSEENSGFTRTDVDEPYVYWLNAIGKKKDTLVIRLESTDMTKLARWHKVNVDIYFKQQVFSYATASFVPGPSIASKWVKLGFKKVIFIHNASKQDPPKKRIEINGKDYVIYVAMMLNPKQK